MYPLQLQHTRYVLCEPCEHTWTGAAATDRTGGRYREKRCAIGLVGWLEWLSSAKELWTSVPVVGPIEEFVLRAYKNGGETHGTLILR